MHLSWWQTGICHFMLFYSVSDEKLLQLILTLATVVASAFVTSYDTLSLRPVCPSLCLLKGNQTNTMKVGGFQGWIFMIWNLRTSQGSTQESLPLNRNRLGWSGAINKPVTVMGHKQCLQLFARSPSGRGEIWPRVCVCLTRVCALTTVSQTLCSLLVYSPAVSHYVRTARGKSIQMINNLRQAPSTS